MTALLYDLLAVDLDGTLLGAESVLPAENRAALHRAHEAGLKIVVCTGRAFTETRPVLEQIGLDLDATVTVFGALVSDARTGRTLERTALSEETARAATAWFGMRGYPVLWLTDPDEAGTDGYMVDGPHRHPAVDTWLERSHCDVACVPVLPEDAAAPVRLSVIDDSERLEDVSARLREEFNGRLKHNVLHAPPYKLSLIEAFAPPVNKWYGIEKLCRKWGLDRTRTVAVGDDVNDLEMIRQAALGVAMGNAKPEVKAAARKVTATNEECGVAVLIEELLSGRGG